MCVCMLFPFLFRFRKAGQQASIEYLLAKAKRSEQAHPPMVYPDSSRCRSATRLSTSDCLAAEATHTTALRCVSGYFPLGPVVSGVQSQGSPGDSVSRRHLHHRPIRSESESAATLQDGLATELRHHENRFDYDHRRCRR